MMVQLDSFQKFFGFHPFSCHCGSLSLQKSLFVNNLWHEVMSTEESRWILGIDQTLVFKNCLLSSTKHLYICEHLWPMSRKSQRFLGLWRTNHLYICKSQGYSGPESPVYLQISWIFANLIYIQGLKGHESPGYSCITWKSWISWIISNVLDIRVLWIVNRLDIHNL